MATESNNSEFDFYSCIICPFCQRVCIILDELQIPYNWKEIDLYAMNQKKPEYLKINPLGKVPAIVTHDHQVLFESLVLIEYLISKYGNGKLVPKDPFGHSQVHLWAKYFDDNIATKG